MAKKCTRKKKKKDKKYTCRACRSQLTSVDTVFDSWKSLYTLINFLETEQSITSNTREFIEHDLMNLRQVAIEYDEACDHNEKSE